MQGAILPCSLESEISLEANDYDGAIYVSSLRPGSNGQPEPFRSCLQKALKIDDSLEKVVSLLEVNLPLRRFVYAPTGPLSRDYDDVRSFAEAAEKGIERALKAGMKKPLLVLPEKQDMFPQSQLVALLGALKVLYVPIQVREDLPDKEFKIKSLGVWNGDESVKQIVHYATVIESGRFVARDIGGGDPERMAAPRVEEYIQNVFGSCKEISINVVSDEEELKKNYPLFSAVNRAARVVDRHKGRIILMKYKPLGEIKKTVFLVGKGITYDTGGADIKAGGVMAGMSRDKCGAATVAGFMKVVSLLKPKGVQFFGALAMARNSVGEECYVADEVITARSKRRVRVGNTDAEGRMVMADVLCQAKEMALNEPNPHLFTIATLTGHACLAVGSGYSIVMDNAPAREDDHSKNLQKQGEKLGDMFEISTIRREDIAFHRGKSEGDDVFQCNNSPSSRTARGHQGPSGFLLLASGLDEHGLDSKSPLKYSHIDIAASGGDLPNEPTGCVIAAFTAHLLTGPTCNCIDL